MIERRSRKGHVHPNGRRGEVSKRTTRYYLQCISSNRQNISNKGRPDDGSVRLRSCQGTQARSEDRYQTIRSGRIRNRVPTAVCVERDRVVAVYREYAGVGRHNWEGEAIPLDALVGNT